MNTEFISVAQVKQRYGQRIRYVAYAPYQGFQLPMSSRIRARDERAAVCDVLYSICDFTPQKANPMRLSQNSRTAKFETLRFHDPLI
jgi:hypothetical protein